MSLIEQLRKLLEESNIEYVYREKLNGLALKISVNPGIPEELKALAETEYSWNNKQDKFLINVYLLVEEDVNYLALWIPKLCAIEPKLKLRNRIKTLILLENPQLYYGNFGLGRDKFITFRHGISLERAGKFITIEELNDYLSYAEYICGDFLKQFITLKSENNHG